MPRDKKSIHRATSDVEDENELSCGEEEPLSTNEDNLEEERRKKLKNIILKRTLALKQQRERKKTNILIK
jgi:hypothetical protein